MPETASKKLKIMAYACDGVGHLNAVCGMLESLKKRGHQIIVLSSEGFKGKFLKYGFEEIVLTEKPKEWGGKPGDAPAAGGPPKNPIKEMALHLKSSGMLSSKTPLEKLKSEDNSGAFLKSIYDQLVQFNPQIEEHIKTLKPDLFIIDHFMVPPALPQSSVPWVFLFSGNPLGLYRSDKLPPFGGGFATTADPATWQEFKKLQDEKFLSKFIKIQEDINAHFGYNPPEGEEIGMLAKPKFLSIYGYPEELDYFDIVPIPEKFARLDAYCREIVEPFELPEGFVKPGEKIIYVSLGSMGSVDTDLIQRITNVLAKTPHKYIVSKGPLGEEYELPPNCWGENFLPQTRILPLVDLVITHGGNNTITETFSMGKPMIVMPLFADQFDNAQRVTEKGYGVRMEPYKFEEKELIDNINKLLNDKEMIAKCQAAAKRIANSNSKEIVCQKLEELVEKFKRGEL